MLLFVRVKAQSSDVLKGLNHNLLTVDGVKAQSSDGLKGLNHSPLECFAHRLGLFGNVLPGYRKASSFPLLDDLQVNGDYLLGRSLLGWPLLSAR